MNFRNSKIPILALIILLIASGVIGTSVLLSRPVDALLLSGIVAKEYAEKNEIPFNSFLLTNQGKDKGRSFYDYESNTNPKHLLRIYIDGAGKVEVNRMIEP